jgi:hypothetical protein
MAPRVKATAASVVGPRGIHPVGAARRLALQALARHTSPERRRYDPHPKTDEPSRPVEGLVSRLAAGRLRGHAEKRWSAGSTERRFTANSSGIGQSTRAHTRRRPRTMALPSPFQRPLVQLWKCHGQSARTAPKRWPLSTRSWRSLIARPLSERRGADAASALIASLTASPPSRANCADCVSSTDQYRRRNREFAYGRRHGTVGLRLLIARSQASLRPETRRRRADGRVERSRADFCQAALDWTRDDTLRKRRNFCLFSPGKAAFESLYGSLP